MWNSVKKWWADPFDSDMDVKGWFLFLGFIIVVSIMWRLILGHIFEGLD